jgi:hypothetical protein
MVALFPGAFFARAKWATKTFATIAKFWKLKYDYLVSV